MTRDNIKCIKYRGLGGLCKLKRWTCMKVRGDYVVSTSKTDDALRLISTASFDIWPQNRWGPSNFQSVFLQRLQFHEISRLVEWDLQKTVRLRIFPRCFEVCCVLFYKQRCRASHAKIWKQQEILEHCTQYRRRFGKSTEPIDFHSILSLVEDKPTIDTAAWKRRQRKDLCSSQVPRKDRSRSRSRRSRSERRSWAA